jgi:hypothetical protein
LVNWSYYKKSADDLVNYIYGIGYYVDTFMFELCEFMYKFFNYLIILEFFLLLFIIEIYYFILLLYSNGKDSASQRQQTILVLYI